MKLKLARNAGAVIRYHTVRTIRQQTLADHQWNVVMILLWVFPEAPSHLLRAALMHDLPEYHTGDVPATAKWGHEPLAAALEAAECDAWGMLGVTDPVAGLAPDEKCLLKFCDGAELVLWCMEEGRMGNRFAAAPAARVLYRFRGVDFSNLPARTRELFNELEREYTYVFGSQQETGWG